MEVERRQSVSNTEMLNQGWRSEITYYKDSQVRECGYAGMSDSCQCVCRCAKARPINHSSCPICVRIAEAVQLVTLGSYQLYKDLRNRDLSIVQERRTLGPT